MEVVMETEVMGLMAPIDTFIKGVPLPLLRPVPIGIPKKTEWYDVVGKTKTVIHRSGSRHWCVEEDYIFPWLDVEVCIPKGFIFDGASIPRAFWLVMNPTGLMFIPSIFHDCGYRYNSWIDKNYNPIFENAGRKFFDDQFKDMGIYVNESNITSPMAWTALRGFGWLGWNQGRKEDRKVRVDYTPKNKE